MDAQTSNQENSTAEANDVSSLSESPANADDANIIDEQPATNAADVTADNSQSQLSTCSASETENNSLNVTFPKQVGNAWEAANITTIGTDSTPNLVDKNANDNNTKKRSNVSFLSGDSITTKPKFADIMAEQELEKDVAKPETISQTKVSFSNEVVVEGEEERMMRLAIEASLQEQQGASHGFQSNATKMPASVLRNSHGSGDTGMSSSFPTQSPPNVSFSNNNVAYDANNDMDDDMRMAIALSLQLGGGSGNSYTSAVFEKSPPYSGSHSGMDSAMNDIKMEDVEDDRKPSAQPKKGVATGEMDVLKPAVTEIMESGSTDESERKSILSDSVYNPPAASASTSAPSASCCANSASAAASSVAAIAPVARTSKSSHDESENLARALHQAELDGFNASQTANADAEAASLQLAIKLQQEEDARQNLEWDAEAARLKREEMCHGGGGGSVGVRTVGRYEFDSLKTDEYHGDSRMTDRRKLEETGMGKLLSSKNNTSDDPGEYYDNNINDYYYYANDRLKGNDAQQYYDHDDDDGDDGIRMNSQSASSKWKRLDKDTFVGPNNEIRTKHDPELKRRSNAVELLGSHGAKLKDAYNHSGNSSDNQKSASVSDRAYNAFRRAESRQSGFKKGVAKQGHGRAENMNAGKTRGGAMDGNVRLQISAAINLKLIEHCNGVVKEGKEALVYHANGGCNIEETEETLDTVRSDGYDVAVKVFKRIAEFKGRGSYVDGDPRYHKQKFKTNDQREQVVLWAEKEYRNLIRAHRSGVAVPKPLYQKENVLMMRFLGQNGWPSPQLKEIDMKKGSQKWTTLYCQTLVAIRRLFHCARLVHADLSEYNLLICPSWQASHENFTDTDKRTADDETLQVVLIDFGMAVETGHPSAVTWLKRDLSTVRDFFVRQGINTLSNDVAEDFVTDAFDGAKHDAMDDTDDKLMDKHAAGSDEMQDDDCHIEAAQGKKWRHNIHGWDDEKNMEELLKKLRGSN